MPENITLLPKKTAASELERASRRGEEERDASGQCCGNSVRRPTKSRRSSPCWAGRLATAALKEGQKLRVLLTPAGLGHMRPLRVIIAGESAIEAAAALSDIGKYVAVDVRNVDTEVAEADEEATEDDGSGVRLYQSIYETALRNNVPNPVIEEFIRIYSYDVDFQRKVQPGDSFDVLYSRGRERRGPQ